MNNVNVLDWAQLLIGLSSVIVAGVAVVIARQQRQLGERQNELADQANRMSDRATELSEQLTRIEESRETPLLVPYLIDFTTPVAGNDRLRLGIGNAGGGSVHDVWVEALSLVHCPNGNWERWEGKIGKRLPYLRDEGQIVVELRPGHGLVGPDVILSCDGHYTDQRNETREWHYVNPSSVKR